MADTYPEIENLRSNVNACAERLREHGDSVIILVTKHDADSCGRTKAVFARRGNYYACRDSVREWLTVEDQKDREIGKSECATPDDDDGDEAGTF